jgi:putative ATP-dependent endonuclease of OLD family
MRISKVHIQNFRNFGDCEVVLDSDAVIVGENKVGKSNFLHALRLVLDPKISDSERNLRLEDFWDGLPRPLRNEDSISIAVDLADFENDPDQLALLSDYLVQQEPMVSRLTFLFQPFPTLEGPPRRESEYQFVCYGGNSVDNRFGFDVRNAIPLNLLPALRDAESDLANWRRSPLAPLLRSIAAEVDGPQLDEVAQRITEVTAEIVAIDGVQRLSGNLAARLEKMAGERGTVDTNLSFSPAESSRLIRSLKLFIDNGARSIGDASLGCANLIYLSLLSLDLERQVKEGSRQHTFLAIEEPEAHLHPHLQRLVFRDFFQRAEEEVTEGEEPAQTTIVTTHSPNIVSVAPLKSLVLLTNRGGDGTKATSTATLQLSASEFDDLQRYLDVNRGECVFASGLILVEGIAEEYLVPAFAKLLGSDLDVLGISVCVVGGTNFVPYVKFFGPNGLQIPIAVLTDLDPIAERDPLAHNRIRGLFEATGELVADLNLVNFVEAGARKGFFVNSHTLELDLLESGARAILIQVLKELTENGAVVGRCDAWQENPELLDKTQFLKDVIETGKGRFAQRLASRMEAAHCPAYIRNAIEYIVEKAA